MTKLTQDAPSPRGALLASGTRVDHDGILRLQGRSGMGEVYLARDTCLEGRA